MLVYPGQLVEAAKAAGMKVPPDLDSYDRTEFIHFSIFCKLQLGRRVVWGEHWRNAEIIASIPEEELLDMTLKDMIKKRGFSYPLST